MSEPDPVLLELDAEIRQLELEVERIKADLDKAREMRRWWAERHPRVVRLGQATEHEQALPIEVMRGSRTLRELILQVLEASREPLTVPRIRDRVNRLGWETTSKNKGTMIRNYLRALIEEHLVERVEGANSGAYRLVKVEVLPAPPGRED